MAHQRIRCTFLFSCIAAVLAAIPSQQEQQQQLLKVIENESDPECYEVHQYEIKSAPLKFQTCLQGVAQQFQISLYLEPKDPTDAIAAFVCQNPPMMQCIQDFQNRLETCLSDAKKKQLDQQILPLYAGFAAACGEDNQGQPIKDLMNNGADCIDQKKYGLMQCVQDVANLMTTQEAETFDDFYSEEGCKHAQDVTSCIITTLATCPDDTASKFFDKVLNAIIQNSHCGDYFSSQYSNNSV